MKNVFDLIEILYHRDNIVVSLFFKCACDCLFECWTEIVLQCVGHCNYCTLVVELKYERRTSTWQSTQRSNQWGVIVFDRCWLKNCSLETCHICKQHKYCQCSFYFYQSVKVQFSLQVKMRGLMPYSVLINAVKIHIVLNLCFLL